MFGLGKASRLKAELKDLQTAIVMCAWKFSGAVSEGFLVFADHSQEPQYRVLIYKDHSISYTYIDQMTLAVEGVAFIFNLVSRSSFRRESNKLRSTVFDQSAHSIVELLAKMIKTYAEDADIGRLEKSLIDVIQEREIQYSKLRSVMGENLEDQQSVVNVASITIAEEVGYPPDNPRTEYLVEIIKTELLRVIKEANVAVRVKRMEQLL